MENLRRTIPTAASVAWGDRQECLSYFAPVNQTNHFFDLGYGWLCKHCSAEDTEREHHSSGPSASRPVGLPLATWTDPAHNTLTCPRCGIHETIAN